MPDVTEFGDILINAYMDEWGFCKIDGLMEDGRIIIAVTITYVNISETASETGLSGTQNISQVAAESQTVTNIAIPLSQIATANAAISNVTVPLMQVGTEPIIVIANIAFSLMQMGTETTTVTNIAFSLTQTSMENQQMTNVMIPLTQFATENGYTATFSITESAAETLYVFSGVVKVTKLFLIIGDLAIQLSG